MKAHCDVVENLPIPMKLLVVFMLVVFVSGCKKHELDPQHAILGKWEPFYLGNGEYRPPVDKPGAYWHFLPDSVLLEYEYATQRTITKKYWIDTLLNIGTPGGYRSYYTSKFYGDTMELHIENSSAIFYVSKWQRIN